MVSIRENSIPIMATLFEINNLTVSYDRHPALHHVTCAFDSGGLYAITGPNGGGKSTLLKFLAGIMTADQGKLVWAGGAPRRVAWLPQQTPMMRQFPLSVLEVVAMGHWPSVSWYKPITRAMRDEALHSLSIVGLQGFECRSIDSLSVGQTQRMLFARLMLAKADVILLDEPFAALDHASINSLLALIQDWHKTGRTILAVLHDHTQLRHYFSHCLLLARRLIAQGTPDQVLSPENLRDAHSMMEAWDENAPACDVSHS